MGEARVKLLVSVGYQLSRSSPPEPKRPPRCSGVFQPQEKQGVIVERVVFDSDSATEIPGLEQGAETELGIIAAITCETSRCIDRSPIEAP
jgi:hypothetical protein